jgi:Xaa-Pro aminopeptidase
MKISIGVPLRTGVALLCLSTALLGSAFEKSEYGGRRQRLMEKIPDGVAVILGATPDHGGLGYRQNNDFFYFTGVEIPDAILIVDGINKESLLFFTITEREADGEGIDLELVRNPQEVAGIERVLERDHFSSHLNRFSDRPGVIYTPFKPEELYRETSNEKFNALQRTMTLNPWDGRLTRELQFVQKLKERYPHATVKDISPLIWNLRKIKSPAEIAVMRKAGEIAAKAHMAFVQSTRVGIKEKELAALFEYVCKKEGADDLGFNTIIMSGKNHAYGHYHVHDRVLQDGDFLILDAGADYDHYKVDFSSSFPANGKFSPRQTELYELANAVRNICLETYRPGITFKDVGKKVEAFLIEQGIDLSDPSNRNFRGIVRWGGYNHPVGMAVHDVMGSMTGPEEVLQPGFVFACDIQIPKPEEKMGIRLEDTVVITETGCEVLSSEIPRTIEEIEAFMKQDGMIQILKKANKY